METLSDIGRLFRGMSTPNETELLQLEAIARTAPEQFEEMMVFISGIRAEWGWVIRTYRVDFNLDDLICALDEEKPVGEVEYYGRYHTSSLTFRKLSYMLGVELKEDSPGRVAEFKVWAIDARGNVVYLRKNPGSVNLVIEDSTGKIGHYPLDISGKTELIPIEKLGAAPYKATLKPAK